MPTDKRLNLTLNAEDIKKLNQLTKELEVFTEDRFKYVDVIRMLIEYGLHMPAKSELYLDSIKLKS